MSKKMKGVALDSSPYGVYGDSKTMFKHQTLMQDYRELHKDVEASRFKLGNKKQRKETLLAEVRFLRHRYKYLLKCKSAKLPQDRVKEHLQPHHAENQRENTMKVQISNKKEATPRVLKPSQKGRVYMGKEVLIQNTVTSFDQNYKGRKHTGKNAARANHTTTSNLYPSGKSYKGKEAVAHQNSMPVNNLNQERIYNGISAAMRNTVPFFDLNQKETVFSGKQPSYQSQAPSFDLNQISREEEFQSNCETLRVEEPKKGLINEDQLSDLRLSVCRNIGNGSNHAGKRKISWQDPVALRV